MNQLEAIQLFVSYLWDCRSDGRFEALEALCYAWKDHAPPEIFACLGRHFVRLAVAKREATVIYLADRMRERKAL